MQGAAIALCKYFLACMHGQRGRFMIPCGDGIIFRLNICSSIGFMDKGASRVKSPLKYSQEIV